MFERRRYLEMPMGSLDRKDFAEALDPNIPMDRRVFIRGVGFVSAALLLGFLGGCEELAEAIRHRPIRRRLRVGSPEVDEDIATYRQAVATMMGRSDAIGWVAQATIHGTVAGGFNFCQHGNDHFFDWHRAYLFYFEKICQKLTGDKKFGLPYWNWNQDPAVHPAFLDTSSPLFMARTRTSMAGNSATTTAALDPIFADTNFFTFSPQLEGTPHNNVHVYIGATMRTGGSALDPLFWAHHCMVDYCWYKWNIELGNNNTNDPSWVNHVDSHFVDADGNPASDTAGITTLMPLLSYQYESSAIGSFPATAAARTKREFQILEKRIREGADIRFDIKRRIHVADAVSASIAKPMSLDARVRAEDLAALVTSDAAKERVFATVEYARVPASSDFVVRVFVNLPNASAQTTIQDPHYAGSFAFFGTEPATPSTPDHQHHPRFLVDLTSTLRRLKAAQELTRTGQLSLQLVPVPFAAKFEKEDTELTLSSLDLIITPVIVNSSPR